MRPARARLNVAARELVAWPGGVQDHSRRTRPPDQLAVGTLGLETNRAPLPHAAAGHARIAHTRACLLVPASPDSLKYALQAHCARHFPCKARPSTCASCFAALPEIIRLELLSYGSAFCQPEPRLLRYIHILVAAVSLQDPERRFMHACARPD
jgi:hypothetical protein